MEEQKVHPHITHFDDCGCLSAHKDAEIAALQEDKHKLSVMLKRVLDASDATKTRVEMTAFEWDAVEAAAVAFPTIKAEARVLLEGMGEPS